MKGWTKRIGLGALAGAAMMAWTSSSQAQEANGFGQKGQFILSADRLFPAFSYTSYSTTRPIGNGTVTTTTKGSSLALLVGDEPQVASFHTLPRVAFDFTIIDRLTLGGSVLLAFGLGGSTENETKVNGVTTTQKVDAPSHTLFGIGPRVGYILPVTGVLAFWFRGGFSFYSDKAKTQDTNNNGVVTTTTDTTTAFSLDLDPELAIVPIPHVFFTVGPLVNIPLSGSISRETSPNGNTTSIDTSIFHMGISTSLGCWFDL